jgi:hypothetical protein
MENIFGKAWNSLQSEHEALLAGEKLAVEMTMSKYRA